MRTNLKTGTKILSAFLLVLALVLGMSAANWSSTRALGAAIDAYQHEVVPDLEVLQKLTQAETAVRANAGVLANAGVSGPLRDEAAQRFRASIARVSESEATWAKRAHTPLADAEWQRLATLLAQWHQQSDALDLAIRGSTVGPDGQKGLLERYMMLIDTGGKVTAQCKKLVAQVIADGEQMRLANERIEARVRVVELIGIGLLVAVLVTVGSLLARSVAGGIRAVVAEVSRASALVAEGHFAIRAKDDAVPLEFRPIIIGVNETMDAFERPLRVTADYLSRIAKGEIPAKITDRYAGDFNLIKSSLNDCIDAVNALLADSLRLAKAGVEGRLSTRADAQKHQGDFRKVVQGVNDTLDAVIGPLTVAAKYLDQISKGQIPERITESYAGDFNTLKDNLNRCSEAVDRLVTDAGMLAQAAVKGELGTRADESRHEGDFRKIVVGVNRTLDAVIGPLSVAARYVDEISRGQIPAKITDSYAGDFNSLKNNLNTCIEAINRLVADAGTLVEAAVAGRLSTRADAARHQGDFKKIVEGVNRTLDAAIAPVNEAAVVLEKLSQRDLGARVLGSFQGDHARVKESVNATAEALHGAMAQVAKAVEQVSSASQQIAASSQAVASGASEQAAALEETSTSLKSVLSITRQATLSSQEANALAQAAKTAATEGATAVLQMQGAMGKIKASAEGTSQIIRDINDIAFQTNLLALNAAVEAARAGEAGRGFAVVADEVRSLALRAKEAAQKTEELIRQSVRQAGEGEGTARQMAGKLGEIVTGIGKVSDIVGEIAAAAKEQAAGIDQVNRAVAEMDKVTQQNAASAEESSSAASELNGQAEELAAMVGAFRIDRRGEAAAVQRPKRGTLGAGPSSSGGAGPARSGSEASFSGEELARDF